jgi:predicted protein tyrosine phosphatase
MPDIFICGVHDLKATVARVNPDLVISITDPDVRSLSDAALGLHHTDADVLKMAFHDVYFDVAPNRAFTLAMGSNLLSDLDDIAAADASKILVHCTMGISRSTAVAVMTLAYLASSDASPSDDLARGIVDAIFTAAPSANPNTRVIEIADRLLTGFDGGLLRAVQARRSLALTRAIHEAGDY